MNGEPTLGDVLEAVKGGFNKLETRIGTLEEGQRNLSEQVTDLQHGQKSLLEKVSTIQEEFEARQKASDEDSLTVLNHEKRIAHLENKNGIPVDPPPHLANI